jgi:conjugative relaxase-like TrwC/TraI family protein
MEGRAAGSTRDDERFLRPAGADGTRAAGIDVTFSAPKSLSIAWALAEGAQRGGLEGAHARAVERAVQYLRATVPTTVSWDPRMRTNQPALARDLLAAEFVHTTARGVGGGAPDPQLHSHLVVTSVVREDGRGRGGALAPDLARRSRGGRVLPCPAGARAQDTRVRDRSRDG